MKILNEVAILMLVVSILIDNSLTDGDLIIRIFLIVVNAACCAMWNER